MTDSSTTQQELFEELAEARTTAEVLLAEQKFAVLDQYGEQ